MKCLLASVCQLFLPFLSDVTLSQLSYQSCSFLELHSLSLQLTYTTLCTRRACTHGFLSVCLFYNILTCLVPTFPLFQLWLKILFHVCHDLLFTSDRAELWSIYKYLTTVGMSIVLSARGIGCLCVESPGNAAKLIPSFIKSFHLIVINLVRSTVRSTVYIVHEYSVHNGVHVYYTLLRSPGPPGTIW